MVHLKKYWFLVPVFAGVIVASLYYTPSPQHKPISILRVSVLPDQSPEILRARYTPLLDYLALRTGIETRLVVPADYFEAVRLFAENKVDLAYLGGLTFVQSNVRHGARPLVLSASDKTLTSCFLTRPEFAGRGLGDFRDGRFSFGSKLSTSGHLMPRQFLQEQWQIDPEIFFSDVEYSGTHDKTAFWVRDGEVDVGVANSAIVAEMFSDGRLRRDEIHVIWHSPPFPDYVWAVNNNVDEAFEIKLRDAFLLLDSSNPKHARILQGMGTEGYLPASIEDYTNLVKVADNLRLLETAEE